MTMVYAVIEMSEEISGQGELLSIWTTREGAEDAIAHLLEEERKELSDLPIPLQEPRTRYSVKARTLDANVFPMVC